MLINGVQLSSLGATLYDRVLSSNDIETTQDWLDGDLSPTFIRQQDTFKNITLKFLITEQNEENAFITMSNLSMLLKRATIVFDDIDLQFDVTMSGQGTQERLKNGNFIFTVKLKSDYAKGQAEVYTTDSAATESFRLTVAYYKDTTTLITTETVPIRASMFDGETITLASLGIEVDKYQTTHYNRGVVTNFNGMILNYATLKNLGILMINYSPVQYFKPVEYYLGTGQGQYHLVEETVVTFTYFDYENYTSIGQLVNLNRNRPTGYRATVIPPVLLTFEELMAYSDPIVVNFDAVENERTRDVTLNFYQQGDGNSYDLITSTVVNVRETDVVEGTTIGDLFNLNGHKPNSHFQNGYCVEVAPTALLTYDNLLSAYNIRYDKAVSNVYVEYYYGEYPSWNRVNTEICSFTYDESYDSAEDLFEALNIDLDKYRNDLYNAGTVFNSEAYTDYDTLANIGVVQIYYIPKEYTITVNYVQDDDGTITSLGSKSYVLTDLMFVSEPRLGQLIDINFYRPEGYAYSEEDSYSGLVTISALTQASPITITYTPVAVAQTKSVIIRYKKQLANTYSTINTSVITIEAAAVGGGMRLSDLIEINKYRPDYYDSGIVDGYSADAVFLFDEIQGVYEIYYFATQYSTQVRYYTDDITIENWIGSSRITYTLLDFEAETTAVSLGVDINAFKPSYCSDGEIQYYGATTFANLINLDAIIVLYTSVEEPQGDDGINYPHRILFLQHNDMGIYENNFPTWTMNHAYINTGVTCADVSKLTVSMSTVRVFEDQPLYNVNVGDAYLFGSITPNCAYYLKYENNTTYCTNPTGVNYFEAMAGNGTPALRIEEATGNGFSRNTGIYASDRDGYSYATLTYSSLLQSNGAQMLVPLYLFACDKNGRYADGIAGVGITSCKIYYDDVLIRDFVPVQFYDLIGTKVAPSNCLYDKVTQTFFEDATGLNSFNIIDDDQYEDDDPLHHIGKCYCNYYKGGDFFQNRVIYFRESDFVGGNVWDPEEELEIDRYQPDFFGTGVIRNINDLGGVTFNNVNEFVFEVNYPSTGYYIDINYYADSAEAGNLIASEQVYLTENMFYDVPTFGQLVDLLKHKPVGYGLRQEDIPYTDTKVTLRRLLNNAPYNIVYTEWENPETYSFTVKYYKHKNWIEPLNPLNQYLFLGETTITIDETDIIDGVYPEDFMNFNLYKPANEDDYWYDGVPFEWYTKDENLLSSDDLREEYIITYEPKTLFIDINYYTDEVDDANLIGSDTWGIKINDWGFGEQFQIVDELPNSYINKYKPVICDGGVLQNSDTVYTFTSLVQQGHLDIVYTTREEPHDPENDSFPSKVIWYVPEGNNGYGAVRVNAGYSMGEQSDGQSWYYHDAVGYTTPGVGPYIPYLNLGYTPKELQRLRMEMRYYSVSDSPVTNYDHNGSWGADYDPQSIDYLWIAGYAGPMDRAKTWRNKGYDNARYRILSSGIGQSTELYTGYSPESTGWFGFRGHCPHVMFGGPSSRSTSRWYSYAIVDGHGGAEWSNTQQNMLQAAGNGIEDMKAAHAGFRLGKFVTQNEDLEWVPENKNYIFDIEDQNHIEDQRDRNQNNEVVYTSDTMNSVWPNKHKSVSWSNDKNPCWRNPTGENTELEHPLTDDAFPATVFHPYTVTLDAYHNYCEIYDMSNTENPYHWNIDTSEDYNLFVDRCKPHGPITLFVSTNPDTGKPNICPSYMAGYPVMRNFNSKITGISSPSEQGQESGNESGQSQPGTNQQGGGSSDNASFEQYGGLLHGVAYNPHTTSMDCPWGDARINMFPVPLRTAIWSVKIWDRDRLVRNLIPVAQGDQIYNYTAPANGMFDLVTEIFFTNANKGGTYTTEDAGSVNVSTDQVYDFKVSMDPTTYGKITVNYYDEDNNFIDNQYVEIPCDYFPENIKLKDLLRYNDMKPSPYYHDGMIDTDVPVDVTTPHRECFKQIYNQGSLNIYYRQISYTKTVIYYAENTRIGSRDFFFSQDDIENATTLADLGILPNLYQTNEFKPGVVMSDESVIADDDIAAFINAPSPVVVYKKWSKQERPDLLYVEYYRGGAYEAEGEETITVNSENANYLDCDLDAVVLNPNGLIKYQDHYHDALYEDEIQPDELFLSYQVDVNVNYCEVRKGPARAYKLLATIVDKGRYTVVEENRGWGRLREYPNGWILLAYTTSVTGPGQNPEYDQNTNAAIVTVPFGTHLHITKMTIDRLWAYVPSIASWIKTEEISFDQSGRLYNALGMEVIDLEDIDWTNVSSLADIGIDTEKYALRYHDASGYTYSGSYTKEAFSDLHNIEIVYPETVYAYTVNYYKDTKENENKIGTGAFSITLSDWNPDWDTFLSTNRRFGYRGKISAVDTFHRTEGMTKDYNNVSLNDEIYVLAESLNSTPGSVLSTQQYSGVNCYLCIWKGYIGYYPASAITADYTMVVSISPTLYRSNVPITLTWDYYNLSANKYKPDASYGDGIFLWNPHTYDKENTTVNFSFEELITTGRQDVLYLKAIDTTYKAVFTKGWINLPVDITDFYYQPDDEHPGIWDIEFKFNNDIGGTAPEVVNLTQYYSNKPSVILVQTSSDNYDVAKVNRTSYIASGIRHYSINDGVITKWTYPIPEIATNTDDSSTPFYEPSTIYKGKDIYQVINYSNKRNKESAVAYRYGDFITGWESSNGFNARTTHGNDNSINFDVNTLIIGGGEFTGPNSDNFSNTYTLAESKTVFYYIKVWKNYYLEHYFVPLPRGYRLPDGTQLVNNTFYDLITQTLCAKAEVNIPISEGQTYINSFNNQLKYPDIYKKYQDDETENPHDYFSEVDFGTPSTYSSPRLRNPLTESDLTVYEYPDVLSKVLGVLPAGTYKVYTKSYSVDQEHYLTTNWIFTGKGWIQNSATTSSYNVNLEPYQTTVTLKGDTPNTATTHAAIIDPINGTTSNATTFTTEQRVQVFAKYPYDGYYLYWDGFRWIPDAYTDDYLNTLSEPETYIIAVSSLFAYDYPIMIDGYRSTNYLAGDRVTVVATLGKDQNWYKLSTGKWIYNNNNLTRLEE